MLDLKNLNHIEVKVKGGKGTIFILDKGEIINSEAEAMLQALHSRSTGGFMSHLKILESSGADNFMSKFYVGYGHKSIGDCGSLTLFIEGVSMLAAKAIQDFKLYNGQEASTRYIDFSQQVFINPLNSNEGDILLEKQRNFYLYALPLIDTHLKSLFPIKEGEKENIYNKAIAAKSFDVARGFLPAAASTNLAWHSNLRQISDRILFLRHHPLEEVRNIALAIESAVIQKYPNSFSDKRYELTEKYQDEISKKYYYHNLNQEDFKVVWNNVDKIEFAKYKNLFDLRPEKTELPQLLNNLGELNFDFKLDFASFRDIQRHRAINQRMPLLTMNLGFNEWYLESLPRELRLFTLKYLKEIELSINELNCDEKTKQYYIPMAYNIANSFTSTLPAVIYMVELRATRFVHPTLRFVAKKIANYLSDECGIKIHLDLEADRFDIRRGEHDIVLK